MKLLLLIFSVLPSSVLFSQYYYTDIIGTNETNQQMKNWLANKVKAVSATGIDNNGVSATNFSEFHEVKENGKAVKITTVTNLDKKITYSRFDDKCRIISLTDSSSIIENTTNYTYGENDRIVSIKNTVKDVENAFNQVETHNWYYDADGKPEKLWRIITNTGAASGTDSLEVKFTKDENGNITDEKSFKKGKETNFVYYYYNENNQLSDIVRFNKKLEKLLPDIMFEYDEKGRMIQKITTTSDRTVGYLIWRYIFDNTGLKTKEALFNNDKKLTGKIEYAYTFDR